MSHTTTIITDEKTRLNGKLTDTVNPPTLYETAIINRSLDILDQMGQATAEVLDDYRLRINIIAQKAPPGDWSTSFWSQIESSIAADHGDNVKGGLGRHNNV